MFAPNSAHLALICRKGNIIHSETLSPVCFYKIRKEKILEVALYLGKLASMSDGKPHAKHLDSQNNARAVIFMALLALQFGFQPILNREFIHGEVIRTVIVFLTEAAKFFLALIMLTMENSTDCFKGWQLTESLQGAALPAAIYSVQNLLLQQAYPNLDFVTFNLLNQSKLLSTAIFVFFLMGQKQSPLQCLALLMLMGGAALISGDSAQSRDGEKSENKCVPTLLPTDPSRAVRFHCSCQLAKPAARPRSRTRCTNACRPP
jgi:hypothetical protein